MLQAKIDGKWQPLPKELAPTLPPDGSVVTFEVLHSFIDGATRKKSWRNQQELRNPIRIKNPDSKGAPIEIGLVSGVDMQQNPLAEGVRRIKLHPRAGAGLHAITVGNSIEGNELAQFMMLSSENESNPLRDPGVTPVFRFKDHKAEAERANKIAEMEMEAMGIALTAKGADLTELAHLHGVSATQTPAQIKQQLVDVAKKNPETFLALSNDPDKDAKVALAAALAVGAVSIDADKSAIVNSANGSNIMQLTTTDRESAMNEFAAFVRNDVKGLTLKAIKTLTSNKKA